MPTETGNSCHLKHPCKKESTTKEIFKEMSSVLPDSAPSYTKKKWARLFQQGRDTCEDEPHSARLVMVVTEENAQKVEKLVLTNRRIKLWQIAAGTLDECFKYEKNITRWVPRMPTRFDK